jgi:hypothetical protein
MRTTETPEKNGTGAIPNPIQDGTGPSAVLLGDLRSLIESTRIRVSAGINTEMVLLYWDIGDRIRKEILGDRRAAYGKAVVDMVSDQLSARYGRGFARANLFHMIHFARPTRIGKKSTHCVDN